ncbi:MAG: DUF2971 domain-containing protein [Pantoea sp. Morm]|uniref:DUF2971 domain-containing protein n=1 Tax=Pantoea sp. Morm TaxID=2601250 RepID=UPI001D3D8E8E|nr:DUF2971 domain-containing protein [Pantoea sp. Morm]
MILYKYVDLGGFNKIIQNFTLKFSKASSFNDPFELISLHHGEPPYTNDQLIRRHAVSTTYGILSLTRNPLNPLMWSHYGKGKYEESKGGMRADRGNDSHAGFVFGIDVNEAGFNSNDENVIPAKYGNVIYTSTKPKHPFENSENHRVYEGLTLRYEPGLLEALQRTFLYKSSHWSYEEEVRVVKNIDRGFNRGEIHAIDKTAFKELYIGVRNAYNKDYLKKIKRKVKNKLPHCNLFACWFDKEDWQFNKIPIDEAIDSIKNQ